MINLYLLTLLPLFIGAFLWIKSRNIVFWEWAGAAVVGLIVVGIMHAIIYSTMLADFQTISGQITKATYHPPWTELYYVTVCTTSGTGKTSVTTCHQEPRTRYHSEYWSASTNIRSEHYISRKFYDEIYYKFGKNKVTERDYRPGLISGDHNIYNIYNKTGYIYPVNEQRYWKNPLKASRSSFSYTKVPKDIKLFEYPVSNDWRVSKRLLGTAKAAINLYDFDKLNAELGPRKKVNLIIIGFGSNSSADIGHWQEAAWHGGKKNDLVITYGGDNQGKPAWVHVFGWTEKDEVKTELETLLLQENINTFTLTKIKSIINEKYIIKDWSKFNYLSIEPPLWAWVAVIIALILTQLVVWYIFMQNNYDKEHY